MKSRVRFMLLLLGLALVVGGILAGAAVAGGKNKNFRVVRPENAPNGCLEGAKGDVKIRTLGPVNVMTVSVKNLPPNTKFNLFIMQLPREPFGIAWYEGTIKTNAKGKGEERFVGRFNRETFAIAPDSGRAPRIHSGGPFPDAKRNPVFGPIHTYHLGLFFDSPGDDPQACPGADGVTPFSGDHRAGIKALSTRAFPDKRGPLRQVAP